MPETWRDYHVCYDGSGHKEGANCTIGAGKGSEVRSSIVGSLGADVSGATMESGSQQTWMAKEGDESKLKELPGCFSELPVTSDVVDRAVAIRKERRMKAPDAIIAAGALVMNARLATRNTADFKNVKELHVEDPFKA